MVLMIDFIRPGRSSRPANKLGAAPQSLAPAHLGVDEKKLERILGTPVVGSNAPTTQPRGKIMKLLPAITFSRSRPHKKKLLILLGAALLAILLAGGTSYALLTHYNPGVVGVHLPTKKYVPPAPKLVPSTLTGLLVDPSVNDRPVTGVMIENSTDARPQSGLDQAGMVFEAIAEGGITRFLAMYQDTDSDYLGPVRSARFYYIEWLLGFDAAYAHVGGSPEALADINAWHVKNLDQFYNAGAYDRISSRYAPHNVYTSIARLNALEASKGFGKSTYTGFARKKEAPSKTPNATSIDMSFSGYSYNAHYDYDAATNTYKRSQAGGAHIQVHKDGNLAQIAPKVVIALVMPYGLEADQHHSSYQTIGSGQMFVFQDGIVQTGTWAKASNTAQFVFTDAAGKPLALNPGQTWIGALGAASQVVYK